MHNRFIYLFLLALLVMSPVSHASKAQSISMHMDISEGGEISSRRINNLIKYLKSNRCDVGRINYENKQPYEITEDIVFLPIQGQLAEGYHKQASLQIINNDALSGSILVRRNTGVNDVEALEGVRIAFLSPQSVTGFKLQEQLFKQHGVNFSEDKITYTQSNLGAISLLLHKDVFAAAIATPLAKNWLDKNALKIVASSPSVETGALWMKGSLDKQMIKNCRSAFLKLTTSNNKSKRLLKLFPLWLTGFTTI